MHGLSCVTLLHVRHLAGPRHVRHSQLMSCHGSPGPDKHLCGSQGFCLQTLKLRVSLCTSGLMDLGERRVRCWWRAVTTWRRRRRTAAAPAGLWADAPGRPDAPRMAPSERPAATLRRPPRAAAAMSRARLPGRRPQQRAPPATCGATARPLSAARRPATPTFTSRSVLPPVTQTSDVQNLNIESQAKSSCSTYVSTDSSHFAADKTSANSGICTSQQSNNYNIKS